MASYENKYGESLWKAAICDRRLITGWKSSFFQDYKPRLSEEDILKRLQAACIMIEEFFDIHAPTHLVGFVCVTYIEFIAIMEAQARSIPVRNIRPVRMKNYVILDDSIYDPPRLLQEKFNSTEYNPTLQAIKEAKEFMASLIDNTMLYEGVVPIKKDIRTSPKFSSKKPKISNKAKTLIKLLKGHNCKTDTHSYPEMLVALHNRFRKPFHDRYINHYMKNKYIQRKALSKYMYAFFPLHLEPELALFLYAPAYQNQIEVIRTIAQSLPAGMNLIVKDHPIGYSRRKVQFYRKLLEIPNVLIANPKIISKDMIDHSNLVTLIGGSIGIEALVRKKPVLVLSPCATYKILNNSRMLTYAVNLNKISKEIKKLLDNYKYDEIMVLRFIATSIDTSRPLNIYSTLLGRKDVFSFNRSDYTQEISNAAKYIMESFEPC